MTPHSTSARGRQLVHDPRSHGQGAPLHRGGVEPQHPVHAARPRGGDGRGRDPGLFWPGDGWDWLKNVRELTTTEGCSGERTEGGSGWLASPHIAAPSCSQRSQSGGSEISSDFMPACQSPRVLSAFAPPLPWPGSVRGLV